jgi:NAD(P)-dependent dehydrogenase (short-subunit alcohol dehydrogenase family)
MDTSMQNQRVLITAGAAGIGRAMAAARGMTIEEQKKDFVSRVSLRTMVTAEDIANMALFLASAAGQHISGQALSVCGNVETMG